jgi:uncharacterized membrane protein
VALLLFKYGGPVNHKGILLMATYTVSSETKKSTKLIFVMFLVMFVVVFGISYLFTQNIEVSIKVGLVSAFVWDLINYTFVRIVACFA